MKLDERGVARIQLNRPDRHNAISAEMIAELTRVATWLAEDKSARVAVLTGAGRSFCAGGDLRWMREQMDADSETRLEQALGLARMLNALNTLPLPLIGALQGNAFGGGVGLVSVCDVAIGVKGLKMGFTEARLGLIPATIAPYVCARMGQARARRVFMSGRAFDAEEAVALGLLARTVPSDRLEDAVEEEVVPYLKCAPGAVRLGKKLVLSFGEPVSEDVIHRTVSDLVARWETDEAREGVKAFLERREPQWRR